MMSRPMHAPAPYRPMPPMRSFSLQKGVALVIGLVFLLITTLIAITAMSGVVMQERMAGNLRNVAIAQAGAESAVRAGEVYLRELISRGEDIVGNCSGSGVHGVFNRDAGCSEAQIEDVERFRSLKDWVQAGQGWAQEYPQAMISDAELTDHNAAGMIARPVFMVEYLGPYNAVGGHGCEFPCGANYGLSVPNAYRITGRSQGVSAAVSRAVSVQFVGIVGGGENSPPPSPPGAP